MVSQDEYNAGMGTNLEARYARYDADGDGSITPEEFNAYEFSRYDRDRDSMLNEEEYGRYTEDDGLFE